MRIFTDSEPTLESIASTKQIERKGLRMTVQELKDKLRNGKIMSYQWIPMADMWADILTKEMVMPSSLKMVMTRGECRLGEMEINKVVCKDDEIRMLNIRNRVV